MDGSRIARMARYFKQRKPTLLLESPGRWVCIGNVGGACHISNGETAKQAYSKWASNAYADYEERMQTFNSKLFLLDTQPPKEKAK